MTATASAIVSLLESARRETAKLPRHPSWVLPCELPRYNGGLSNFPAAYGCRNLNVTGFDIVGFYGEWGSVGVLKDMLAREKHKRATAEKFECWLEKAGVKNLERVWHTNVLHALRNCQFNRSKKSESGDHRMYHCPCLMRGSAVINLQVERAVTPSLNVTMGIAAAVAFCHTHPGGDPDGHFASYREHGSLRTSKFNLGMLYPDPYALDDGSIVVHLCHPDMHHLTSARRRSMGQPCYDAVQLLKAGVEQAGLA